MVTNIYSDCGEEAAKAKFLKEWKSTIEARIPAFYRDTDPADPRLDARIISACGAWEFAPRAKGLGFCGPTGLGKTRGVYWLMLRLMERVKFAQTGYALQAEFINCRSINDAEFCELVRTKHASEEAKKKIEQLYRCDILFIDDIGQGEMTSATCSGLYSMLERRNGSYSPVFFTTNFHGDDLVKRFPNDARGNAVVRRLAENCKVIVLEDEIPPPPTEPELFAGTGTGKAT